MNNYPSWWDTTITVYNRYEDKVSNLITWYRHTINGCFWKYTGNKIRIGNNTIETNDIICRIRKDDAYLPNYEWQALGNDQKGNYFTLSGNDIIVVGEVTEYINEYQAGSRSSDFITKYKALQGCMKIEQFADNTGGGRGMEHYYVKGV